MALPTIDLTKGSNVDKFAAKLKSNPAQANALFDNSIEQMLSGAMFPLNRKEDEKTARAERDSRIVSWCCVALGIAGLSDDQYGEAVELIRAVTFNPKCDYMSSVRTYGSSRSPAWQLYASFDHYNDMPAPDTVRKSEHLVRLMREFTQHLFQRADSPDGSSDRRYALRSVLTMCCRGISKKENRPASLSQPYTELLLEIAERSFEDLWDHCGSTIFSQRVEENAQKILTDMVLQKFEPHMAPEIADYIVKRNVLTEPMRVRLCERLVADGSYYAASAAVQILTAAGLEETPKKILFDFLANVPQAEAVRLRPVVEECKRLGRARDEYHDGEIRRYTNDTKVFEDLEKIYIRRIFITPPEEPDIEKLSLEDCYKFAEVTGEIYKIQPTRAFAVAARLIGVDLEKPRMRDDHYSRLYDVLLKTYNEYACHENVNENARSAVVGAICSLIIHKDAPISLVRHFADAVADAGMRGISPAVVFYTANRIAQKADIPVPRRLMMIDVLKNLLQHENPEIRSAAEAGRAQIAAEQLGLAHSSLLPENFFQEGGGQQALLSKIALSKFELPLIELPKPSPGSP